MQWPLIHVSNCATFVGTLCMHVWALTGTLAYYYEDSPQWWCHRDTPVTSSGVGIPFPTVMSFSTNRNTPLMQWLFIHVSNSATFVGTLCIHVWALTGTLAYYEGSPHWWHHRNIPVMSSRVGIPSPTIIGFGTDSNTLLFIWFSPYSETFFLLFSYMYQFPIGWTSKSHIFQYHGGNDFSIW